MTAIEDIRDLAASDLISWAIASFQREFAICTSFQDSGMALIDIAAQLDPGVRVMTLDTGRLPEETHQMIETVRERYGINVELIVPDVRELESMTTLHGPNLFHREPALRRLCCQIRKVRPLERKLASMRAVAFGVRREQTDSRSGFEKAEFSGRTWKLHPLADWTAEQVRQYLDDRDIPRHPLYSRGYKSIGCAPCTRPVRPGEGARVGRWWWEEDTAKECGLHVNADGMLRRRLDILLEEVVSSVPVASGRLH